MPEQRDFFAREAVGGGDEVLEAALQAERFGSEEARMAAPEQSFTLHDPADSRRHLRVHYRVDRVGLPFAVGPDGGDTVRCRL